MNSTWQALTFVLFVVPFAMVVSNLLARPFIWFLERLRK